MFTESNKQDLVTSNLQHLFRRNIQIVLYIYKMKFHRRLNKEFDIWEKYVFFRNLAKIPVCSKPNLNLDLQVFKKKANFDRERD